MYLLDTNIVSDARKGRDPVTTWIGGQTSAMLFISVVTLGEISRGVWTKRRRDPTSANHIAGWLERTRVVFAERVLDVTDDIAIEWGRLSASRTRGEADGLIAATALVHNLVLVTRNVADFADTGVTVLNPWAD